MRFTTKLLDWDPTIRLAHSGAVNKASNDFSAGLRTYCTTYYWMCDLCLLARLYDVAEATAANTGQQSKFNLRFQAFLPAMA